MFHQVLEVVQQQAVVQAVSSPRGVAVQDPEYQCLAFRGGLQGRVQGRVLGKDMLRVTRQVLIVDHICLQAYKMLSMNCVHISVLIVLIMHQ